MTFIVLILLHCTLIILYIRWKKEERKRGVPLIDIIIQHSGVVQQRIN